ncbi:Scramblase-domain-containing protein [Meredithblackwellia eburnea MCA 4105]
MIVRTILNQTIVQTTTKAIKHANSAQLRPFTSSSTHLRVPSRNNSGSRLARTPRRSREHINPPDHHPESSPATQPESSSPPTPPWPTTVSPGGANFPYNSYNQGPPSPDGTRGSALAPSTKPEVSVAAEGGPPISTLPVEVPRDENGVLDNAEGLWSERARALFSVPAIVVVRQLEMMNLFLGYEEANKYQLLAPDGTLLGYLMEEDLGFGAAIARQALRTHRAFKATVLDKDGNVLLRIRRPFSWINSRIFISTPSESGQEADEQIIGETQQEWHLWRRKYHHFLKRDGENFIQFGTTDSGLLAWDFYVRDESGKTIGSINRNFAGFGRELFTDTGQYVLRFEGVVDELLNPRIESPPAPDALPSPQGSSSVPIPMSTVSTTKSYAPEKEVSSVPALIPLPSITYDQRAVMLASAVSIDFDYFTRSRGGLGSGMGLWMPFPMGGGGGGGTAETGPVAAGVEEPAATPTSSSEDGQDSRFPQEQEGEQDYGSGGWSETPYEDQGEVMNDPWASNQGQAEEGGTWSWGDLFPSDE